MWEGSEPHARKDVTWQTGCARSAEDDACPGLADNEADSEETPARGRFLSRGTVGAR